MFGVDYSAWMGQVNCFFVKSADDPGRFAILGWTGMGVGDKILFLQDRHGHDKRSGLLEVSKYGKECILFGFAGGIDGWLC